MWLLITTIVGLAVALAIGRTRRSIPLSISFTRLIWVVPAIVAGSFVFGHLFDGHREIERLVGVFVGVVLLVQTPPAVRGVIVTGVLERAA